MYNYDLGQKDNENIEKLNKVLAYEVGNPIYRKDDMIIGKNIAYSSMEKEWKIRVGQMNDFAIESVNQSYNIKLIELRELLLSFSGDEVFLQSHEKDVKNILSRGQLYYGDKVMMMLGENRSCHTNSCCIWDEDRTTSRICTGYALSNDGLWREHSWVIYQNDDGTTQVVETTVERVLYFGFIMTYEECESFLGEYQNFC